MEEVLISHEECLKVRPSNQTLDTYELSTEKCIQVMPEPLDILIPSPEKDVHCLTLESHDVIIEPVYVYKTKCLKVDPLDIAIRDVNASVTHCIEIAPERFELEHIIERSTKCFEVEAAPVEITPFTVEGKKCIVIEPEKAILPVFVDKVDVETFCMYPMCGFFTMPRLTLKSNLSANCS